MRTRLARPSAICFLLASSLAIAQAPSGGWFDSPPKTWNRPGGSLPKAPQDADRDEIPSICKARPRRADTPEERTLARLGWIVFSVSRGGRGVTIVGAAGTFAGTLSPALMGARSDGGSVQISFLGSGKIVASFDRYTREDPLCCPSRISEATYEIRNEAGKAVVILSGVRTHGSV